MPGKQPDTIERLMPHLPELIGGITASYLVAFLRDAEPIAPTVLRGFRATPDTVKSPVVRSRLIKEAEKDESLVSILISMWVDSQRGLWGRTALSSMKELKASLDDLVKEHGPAAVRIALKLDDRQTANRLADKLESRPRTEDALDLPFAEAELPEKAHDIESEPELPVEELRDDNRGLREKLKGLEKQLREAQRLMDERRHDADRAGAELKAARQQLSESESQKQIERAEKTSDRLRRAKEAADSSRAETEREIKRLRKQLSSVTPSEPSGIPDAKPVQMSAVPDWATTVSAILKNGHHEAAQVFCETLIEFEPDNLQAHLVLEHVYAKTGAAEHRIRECTWIAEHLIGHGQAVKACAFACRALEADMGSHDARSAFRRAVERVDPGNEGAVSQVRGMLSKLRTASTPAFREARKLIKQIGKKHTRAFEAEPQTLHPDKAFALDDGKRSAQVSIRGIARAVDTNDLSTVEFLGRALSKLRVEQPAQYRTIVDSIQAHDRSCICAIMGEAEPVVVDGSNVAWHESGDKPRLQNILEVREELRSHGFFPVHVYVDAALVYQIDRRSALQQLIESGAILSVDGHTDADETILNQARMLSCPVVTNDRMSDWDPNNEIPKLRFAIDGFGVTVYER